MEWVNSKLLLQKLMFRRHERSFLIPVIEAALEVLKQNGTFSQLPCYVKLLLYTLETFQFYWTSPKGEFYTLETFTATW